MKRSFAAIAAALVLTVGSSTAAWAGCACSIGNCVSGFSKCWFDDGGTCITVSGRCTTPITLIAGSDVITLVQNDPPSDDARYAYAGCNRTLTERSYTAAEAEALRAATHQLSL